MLEHQGLDHFLFSFLGDIKITRLVREYSPQLYFDIFKINYSPGFYAQNYVILRAELNEGRGPDELQFSEVVECKGIYWNMKRARK